MNDATIPNREDVLRLEDREDGELSDEGGEQNLPAMADTDMRSERQVTAYPSETEIDRIIREAQNEMTTEAVTIGESSQIITTPQSSSTPAMISGTRNTLDQRFLEDIAGVSSIRAEGANEDPEELRRAALNSMRLNGAEDGEIRDIEPAGQIRDRNAQPRFRTVERIQSTSSPIETRRRDNDYQMHRRSSYWHSAGSLYDRKRSRNKNRSISPENRRNKQRRWNNQRSISRERRRSKERRDDREKRRDGSAVLPQFILDPSSQEAALKNRRTRSELDHQLLIFGGHMPSEPVHLDNQTEDNHELVNMEVDSEENTPPSSPNRPRQSFEDETTLRDILMEQMNKKGKNVRNEQSETPTNTMEIAKEEQYEKNKTELKQLDELMTARIKDIRNLNKQRLRQMKELQDIMTSLTRCHAEYWKANERRKQVRPIVEKYEEDQLIEMTNTEPMMAFYRVVEEQSAQLTAIATATQGRLLATSIPSSPAEPVIQQSAYINPEQGEQDMDLSLTPVYTAEDENEINLRQILLEKQRSKVVSTTVGRAEADAQEEPSTTTIEHTPSPAQLSATHFNKEPVYEPRTPEQTPNPCGPPEEIVRPTDRLPQFLKNCRLPLRLFPHAGLSLPNEYELERTVCPFEMSGKCKDCECEHRHLKDDKLKIREIVSMILWHAPSIAGRYARESHSAQIDHVLALQKPGEDRQSFLRNLLKPIVEAYGVLTQD